MSRPDDALSFTRRRHAFAEAAASFAGSVFLSLLLGQFLSGVRGTGFVPLAALDAIDRDVSQLLVTTPRLAPPVSGEFRRVVLVDVDEDTMSRYRAAELDGFTCADCAFTPGQSTPRDLLAELIARVRRAGAGVVLLDFDLRDARAPTGDDRLRSELSRLDETAPLAPVVVPRLVHPTPGGECGVATGTPGRAFGTIVDGSARTGRVEFAHGYIVQDVLGNANAICPAIAASAERATESTTLPAAALLALDLAGVHAPCVRPDGETARPIGFHVGAAAAQLAGPDGRSRVYERIAANKLFWGTGPSLAGAIVVIGASHAGSEDLHATALGAMPGALVHANALLDFQTCATPKPRPVVGFLIEFALTLLLAAIYAYVYVYRGALAAHRHAGRWPRALMRTFVFVVTLTCSLAIGGLYYLWVVPAVPTGEVAVVAPFVALCGEVLYEVLKTLNQWVERLVLRGLGAGHG